MSQIIGQYNLATYTRLSKRLSIPTKENTSVMTKALGNLCDILSEASFEWFLVGGLGIDMHLGKKTRFHHDIDIEVPSEQINELLSYMKDNDYLLFRKVMSTNIPIEKRLVVYQEANNFKCVPETPSRFRLVKCDKGRVVDGILDPLSYIDVSFTRKNKEGIEVGYHGKSVVLPVPYTGNNMIVEVEGSKIRLRHPLYHAYLKKGSNLDVDIFDMNNLKKLLKKEQLDLIS